MSVEQSNFDLHATAGSATELDYHLLLAKDLGLTSTATRRD